MDKRKELWEIIELNGKAGDYVYYRLNGKKIRRRAGKASLEEYREGKTLRRC